MGVYSEMDIDRQFGSGFTADDPFADDADEQEVNGCYMEQGGVDEATEVPQEDKQEEENIPAAQSMEKEAAEQPSTVTNGTSTEPNIAADTQSEDDAARAAHEAAEKQRKAEWDAEQKQKKDAEKLLLAQIDSMSDEDVLEKVLKRVSEDTEKLTRRQMMECVMEHIQTLCLSDPSFARKVAHPRKNMIHCNQYINRKAWEYVQAEMKAKGAKPGKDLLAYSAAIGEGICYQWAEDYFNDPDAPEDKVEQEKFSPKPYQSKGKAKSAAKGSKGAGKAKGSGKDAAQNQAETPKPPKKKPQDDSEQISFGDFSMLEGKAG